MTPDGPGQRKVTVSVTSNQSSGTNTLKSVQFDEIRLAQVTVPGQPASTVPFAVTYPTGTTNGSFVVKRLTAGSLMIRLTVTDACGAWPTFVGAGPDAGW